MKGLPGEVVSGRYRIEDTIGTGGFGTVFSGRQINLDRRVAVKVMRQGPESPEVSRERFRREAVLTSALNHANIVTYHDFLVDDDGDMLLVMEYLDGVTLEQLIARNGCLDVQRAIRLAVEAARGLAESHRSGIIHRDIKPSNIFVVEPSTCRERAKVIDFGILCVDPGIRESLPELTRENAFIGTPEYVAPEILIGGQPDSRTDQYALALVVLRAITGEKPFNLVNERALLQRLTVRPPVLGAPVFEKNAALKGVLYKALSPHPVDRFDDMDQFADALAAAMTGVGPQIPDAELEVTRCVTRGKSAEVSNSSSGSSHPVFNRYAIEIAIAALAVAVAVAGWWYVNRDVEVPVVPQQRVIVQQPVVPRDGVPAQETQKVTEERATRFEPEVTGKVEPELAAKAAPEATREADDSVSAESPARKSARRVDKSRAVDADIRPRPTARRPDVAKVASVEPQPVQNGNLRINVEPWAYVFINGRAFGQSPLNRGLGIELAPGTYNIEFQRPDLGITTSRTVTIKSGENRLERVKLN